MAVIVAATPMTEYIAGALFCAGMLLLVAVGLANIRINLRRRPFNYKALTAAGSVGSGLSTLGLVVLIWPGSVAWALVIISMAIGFQVFAFYYARRLSRRYEAEGRK